MATGHNARRAIVAFGIALAAAMAGSAFAGASSAGSAAKAAPQKEQLPMKTIGVMGPVDAAEIIKLSTDATVAAAKALGWKTVRVDPGGDPAKMGAGMTSLVNSGVDAIVLTTIEPGTIASGLRAARAKKIPVIDTHTLTQSSPLFAGEYFLPPRTEFSLLLARMKRDLPSGSEIGTINLPQFLNAKLAGDYIKQAAPANGWKIVASHDTNLQNLVPDAQRAVGDMIRANPGIDAIFGCCDFAPAGAVPAIRASGKKIKVYSLHGVASAMPQARTGLAVLEVADYQRGAIVAIDQLARHFATGAAIPKRMPGRYQMTIVDQRNARSFPYPTAKVLAPFKAKWARLYIKAS
jgi:ABC-type sugar transport system substrate-binding protein